MFSKFWRSLEQFIQTVKSQNNFWNRMFFNLFLEVSQIKFKLEKIIGVQKSTGKVRNCSMYHYRGVNKGGQGGNSPPPYRWRQRAAAARRITTCSLSFRKLLTPLHYKNVTQTLKGRTFFQYTRSWNNCHLSWYLAF